MRGLIFIVLSIPFWLNIKSNIKVGGWIHKLPTKTESIIRKHNLFGCFQFNPWKKNDTVGQCGTMYKTLLPSQIILSCSCKSSEMKFVRKSLNAVINQYIKRLGGRLRDTQPYPSHGSYYPSLLLNIVIG